MPVNEGEVEQVLYCNNCAARLYFPERAVFKYDGRFCDQACKDEYELKRARWVVRKQIGV